MLSINQPTEVADDGVSSSSITHKFIMISISHIASWHTKYRVCYGSSVFCSLLPSEILEKPIALHIRHNTLPFTVDAN